MNLASDRKEGKLIPSELSDRVKMRQPKEERNMKQTFWCVLVKVKAGKSVVNRIQFSSPAHISQIHHDRCVWSLQQRLMDWVPWTLDQPRISQIFKGICSEIRFHGRLRQQGGPLGSDQAKKDWSKNYQLQTSGAYANWITKNSMRHVLQMMRGPAQCPVQGQRV